MHETISIQGRIRITSFATLARAYMQEGHTIKTKSDVLWRAVEQLALLYSRKHGTEAFDSIPDALEYLDSVGLSLGTNSRAQKTILQAQSDEAYFLETGERVGRPTTKATLEDVHMSPEDLRSAAERIAASLLGGVADEG